MSNRSLMKLTRARRLTDAQRDMIDSDREVVSILIGWARRKGGEDFPAEELVHDSIVVAAASYDSRLSTWRGWATKQVRYAFARYGRARERDRKDRKSLIARASDMHVRVHGRPLVRSVFPRELSA